MSFFTSPHTSGELRQQISKAFHGAIAFLIAEKAANSLEGQLEGGKFFALKNEELDKIQFVAHSDEGESWAEFSGSLSEETFYREEIVYLNRWI